MAQQLRKFTISCMTVGVCADFHVTVEKPSTAMAPNPLPAKTRSRRAYRTRD